jgi:thiamine biosynthesis lipoprotein
LLHQAANNFDPLKASKLAFTVIILLQLVACASKKLITVKIEGKAQGTSYRITYLSDTNISYQTGIDSLLESIDASLSTYDTNSIISRINRNDSFAIADDDFIKVFNNSIDISRKTNGSFDITVAPLVNAWGFGFTQAAKIDSAMIDSLLQFVGYKMVQLRGRSVVKEKSSVMLDFNAIAQGYTVDVLSHYLEDHGIENYLVELGGEVRGRGKKITNEYWRVGIDRPAEESLFGEQPLQAAITLIDCSLATSGNYRKYIEENGQRYSHIINPMTGYPAKHNLLSATVMASDCMTADAYATAFMVMGMERSKQFLSENSALELEVFFIYGDGNDYKTYASEGLKAQLEELNQPDK